MSYVSTFMRALKEVADGLDPRQLDDLAHAVDRVRGGGGRLFVVGVGGSAANATHAACDLRALCGVEAYAPADNAASLTAAANDHGWDQSISVLLRQSRLGYKDGLMVFSVGGGSVEPAVSLNLVRAVEYARSVRAFTCGVVGPRGGVTAALADICVTVPVPRADMVTTHTEIFQSVVWHLLATHPALTRFRPHWESLGNV